MAVRVAVYKKEHLLSQADQVRKPKHTFTFRSQRCFGER